MTWTKLSDEFGDECASLSDAAFRTHVEGLLWTMRRETGGILDERDIRRLAETSDPESAVAELLSAGFWERNTRSTHDVTYHVVHHMEHQDDSDVIRTRREKAAQRTRDWRRKKAGLPPRTDTVTVTETSDDTRTLARGGSGRVGSGLVGTTSHQTDPEPASLASGEVTGEAFRYPQPKPRATPEEYANGASAARAAIQKETGEPAKENE